MANSVCEVLLTEKELAATKRAFSVEAGAVVEFFGVVRRMEDGREIDGIDYEANRSMAEHQLRQIAESAVIQFQLKDVILHHRIGFVGTGEPSLFLRVSASHRAAAFEASRWMVDELKKKVPIWKRPVFAEAPASPAVLMNSTFPNE